MSFSSNTGSVNLSLSFEIDEKAGQKELNSFGYGYTKDGRCMSLLKADDPPDTQRKRVGRFPSQQAYEEFGLALENYIFWLLKNQYGMTPHSMGQNDSSDDDDDIVESNKKKKKNQKINDKMNKNKATTTKNNKEKLSYKDKLMSKSKKNSKDNKDNKGSKDSKDNEKKDKKDKTDKNGKNDKNDKNDETSEKNKSDGNEESKVNKEKEKEKEKNENDKTDESSENKENKEKSENTENKETRKKSDYVSDDDDDEEEEIEIVGTPQTIFTSKDYDKKKTVLLLVPGSGAVRAGQWARSICINDNLAVGTMFPFIDWAYERDWGVVLFDPNGKSENGRRTMFSDGHVIQGYNTFVAPLIYDKTIENLLIVCHSAGGGATSRLLGANVERSKAEFGPLKNILIAGTDTWFIQPPSGKNNRNKVYERIYVHDIVNWKTSNKKGDSMLQSSFDPYNSSKGKRNSGRNQGWGRGFGGMMGNGFNEEQRSCGHRAHEYSSAAAFPYIFKFFDARLDIKHLAKPNPNVKGSKGTKGAKGKTKEKEEKLNESNESKEKENDKMTGQASKIKDENDKNDKMCKDEDKDKDKESKTSKTGMEIDDKNGNKKENGKSVDKEAENENEKGDNSSKKEENDTDMT